MEKKANDLYAIAETCYYTSQILGKIAKTCELEVRSINVNKNRMKVYLHAGIVVAIMPSKGRGDVVISNRPDAVMGGVKYAVDPLSKGTWVMAVEAAITAIHQHGVEDAIRVIGSGFGVCAICGATLTDDLSVTRGIGPECIKKIGVKSMWRAGALVNA